MKIPPKHDDSMAALNLVQLYLTEDIPANGSPIYDLDSGRCVGRMMPTLPGYTDSHNPAQRAMLARIHSRNK